MRRAVEGQTVRHVAAEGMEAMTIQKFAELQWAFTAGVLVGIWLIDVVRPWRARRAQGKRTGRTG